MPSSDGKGLELQLRIKKLMRRHGVEIGVEHLHLVPLTAPTDGPMLLSGVASSTDIDLHRMKFRSYAFGFPLPKYCRDVPVLYRHDPAQVAGRIEQLEYDDRGGLLVRARVDHEQARRCNAFSIAATVYDYSLHDIDGSDFFAVITNARLDEISCTDVPANPHARVTSRMRTSARVEMIEHALSAMQLLQQSLTILQKLQQNGVRP